VKLLCIPVLLATCAGAQMVEDTIVNSVTGWGIGAARVMLIPDSGEATDSAFAITDALGRFVFKDIKPGTYRFGCQSPGYSAMDPRLLVAEFK
jgi:hypothetical protein